jgi:hypothetical protein
LGSSAFDTFGSRYREHFSEHALDLIAPPEPVKRLVIDRVVFVPRDQHRMQRPVKIPLRADAGDLDRIERIDHRARPDRNSGAAQEPRKCNQTIE